MKLATNSSELFNKQLAFYMTPKLISGEVDVENIDVRTPDNKSGGA
ncbi:MAG: hypothetical protein WCE94_03925 [Candidatus Methanoperedens sp.]